MAHNLDMTNGPAFAYNAEHGAAWHGLGKAFSDLNNLDTMAAESGLDYIVQRSKVRFATGPIATDGTGLVEWPEQHVIFRTDSQAPLAIVSAKFNVHHQPKEALALMMDRAKKIGATMSTAMALKGGRIIVATAKTSAEHNVSNGKGGDDLVRSHINFGSSFDGSMRTIEFFSDTRIVCWNTLQAALGEEGVTKIKTSHRTQYNQSKSDLALNLDSFAERMKLADEMARYSIDPVAVQDYFSRVYCDGKTVEEMNEDEETRKQVERMLRRVIPSYTSSPGASLPTANGTLWGALNAVTYDIDHVGTQHTDDARAVSAMFGAGADIKAQAWNVARQLVAA